MKFVGQLLCSRVMYLTGMVVSIICWMLVVGWTAFRPQSKVAWERERGRGNHGHSRQSEMSVIVGHDWVYKEALVVEALPFQ